jgi:hypothetical protein
MYELLAILQCKQLSEKNETVSRTLKPYYYTYRISHSKQSGVLAPVVEMAPV